MLFALWKGFISPCIERVGETGMGCITCMFRMNAFCRGVDEGGAVRLRRGEMRVVVESCVARLWPGDRSRGTLEVAFQDVSSEKKPPSPVTFRCLYLCRDDADRELPILPPLRNFVLATFRCSNCIRKALRTTGLTFKVARSPRSVRSILGVHGSSDSQRTIPQVTWSDEQATITCFPDILRLGKPADNM